jgi:hypothetical protein
LRNLDDLLRNLHNGCIGFVTTVDQIPLGFMRITHSDCEHLIVVSDAEAAALVEASALLVIASQSVAGAALPPRMETVLGQLFDGLKLPNAVSSPPQDN